MKQAIIVLAHNDIPLLIHLIEYFDRDCDIFIHIDKRMRISKADMEKINSFPQVVVVYQKYAVHWGGFSILKTELFMLREAHDLSSAQTFHVISGHDYPIKPLSCFLEFFDKHREYNYITFGRVKTVGTDFDSYYRYQYYFPYDYVDNLPALKNACFKWIKLQRKLHINRGFPTHFDRLYCGSQWFSITRSAVHLIVNYTDKHKSFYRRMRFTFAPEETYFVTLLLNLCDSNTIVNKNFRFIRWHKENGNSPANLNKAHLHLLAETNDFFARKIVSPYHEELVPLIDKYLLKSPPVLYNRKGFFECNLLSCYSYDPGLTEAIYNYCNWLPCYDVLDIGCGPGFYVAAFRRLGLFASGFDINPYTAELSALLLPDGDSPCICADITEKIDIYDDFGVVLCINVLQHISEYEHYKKSIDNLLSIVNKSLVIAWDKQFEENSDRKCFLNNSLKLKGLIENSFATGYFKRLSKAIEYIHVYEKVI